MQPEDDEDGDLVIKLKGLDNKSAENKRLMREAMDKRKGATRRKKKGRKSMDNQKTEVAAIVKAAPVDGSLEDLAAMIRAIEQEGSSLGELEVGDQTSREARGHLGRPAKPQFSGLATLNEDEEYEGSEEELSDDEEPPEQISLELRVGTLDAESDRLWDAARNIGIKQTEENQKNMDSMNKTSKKIHKSLVTKLGGVQLGSFSHAELRLKDGSTIALCRPSMLALLRHPTNPGPDRFVMFAAPPDELQSPQNIMMTPRDSPHPDQSPLGENTNSFSSSMLARAMAAHVEEEDSDDYYDEDQDEEDYYEEESEEDFDSPPPVLIGGDETKQDDDEEDEEEDSDDEMPEPIMVG